jgi:hypothetical protein
MDPLRIAMWSGPRNISTAMMRSWGSRPDTVVIDEPFYAHYLSATGRDHPGRDEVIAHHDSNWHSIVRVLTGPIAGGKRVFYQKHMAHHLPEELPADAAADDARLVFLDELINVLLIRDPREVLVSLSKVLPRPSTEETGLPQQTWLRRRILARTGRPPPVIDARDVLLQPRRTLGLLCAAVGVAFDDAMLSWAPGRRATDGVWAQYWYAAVEKSTGFEPYEPRSDRVPEHLAPVLAECEGHYRQLHEERLH